jgi:hypothetical protein
MSRRQPQAIERRVMLRPRWSRSRSIEDAKCVAKRFSPDQLADICAGTQGALVVNRIRGTHPGLFPLRNFRSKDFCHSERSSPECRRRVCLGGEESRDSWVADFLRMTKRGCAGLPGAISSLAGIAGSVMKRIDAATAADIEIATRLQGEKWWQPGVRSPSRRPTRNSR